MEETRSLSFGSFRLDLRHRQLWRDQQPLELQPKPLAVLQYLIEHPGRVITKEELLKQVWAGVYVSNTALKVCVRAIREALGDTVEQPIYLETVGREGYRFIGKVVSGQSSVVSPPPMPPLRSQLGTGNWELATCLVGRETELTHLHQLLEKAMRGERQIVFVTGEPGIGKTTVVDAFLHSLESRVRSLESEDQAAILSGIGTLDPRRQALDVRPWIARGQCLEQYGEGEAYLPVMEALGQLCRGPGGEQVLTALRRYAPTWLVQMPALVQEAELDALQRKAAGATRERMLREVAEALEALTVEQGVVFIFEDLHWSDWSTLDLLAYLAQRRAAARLLAVGTYRPADLVLREHPLKGIKQELQIHGQCVEVRLELLTEGDVQTYVTQRLGSQSPAEGLAEQVYRRTDGNPLFMVNVVEQYQQQGRLDETAPASVQEMIGRQIARLSEEQRQVLEAGSVMGNEFAVAAVATVLKGDPEPLEELCEELAQTGRFLQEAGIAEWPDGTLSGRYRFRHALYQNVFYQRIGEARRVRLHRVVGAYGERVFGERAKEMAAELAMHFERGRDSRRAVQYLRQTGENALRRSAYHEAIGHLTKGIHLLQTLPETPERAQQEVRLQTILGSALMSTQGFASPEAKKAYTRAQELCQQLGETPALFPVLFGLWRFYNGRAESQPAREVGEQMLRAAQSSQAPLLLLGAHYMLGTTALHGGEPAHSRTHCEKVEALYSPSQHEALSALYGTDLGVSCKAYLAVALGILGYPQQAMKKAREAIVLAATLSHPISMASALFFALLGHQYRGEDPLVQERAAELIALCQEYGFRYWLANGMIVQGWLLADHGQIEQEIVTLRALGSRIGLTLQLGLLADAYRKVGRLEEALKAVDEGLTIVQNAGEQVWGAELYRLKGELLLAQESQKPKACPERDRRVKAQKSKVKPSPRPLTPGTQEAEACFLKAIEVARQQQAKSLELRATVSLARLWQRQASEHGAGSREPGAGSKEQRTRNTDHVTRTRLDETRQMLSEIYGWFTEGFETKDLQEAKALLDDLESSL
jgi:DNA-binding winged helix-turn-helix (wHTH) protein/predicted ATPase